MDKKYNPAEIEKKWQAKWEKDKTFLSPPKASKNKKYVLDMFPYPSGAGLHVGHPLGYIASDIYARYLRWKKIDVLHPMGWDAFGLPAENYAIKKNVHPQISTDKNIANLKRQLKMLGLSFDWSREINTSGEKYYKWTQWLFLQLYKNGLAYRKLAPVNWCQNCKTVLANEQVVDGRCERCKHTVVQKKLEQWFFKITDYAEELLRDLRKIDWSDSVKTMQKNWIGRSEGAVIKFKAAASSLSNFFIEVFTTRPDTLFGATYLVLAPESEAVKVLLKDVKNLSQVKSYIEKTRLKTDLQRTDLNKDKTGVLLKGVEAINPVNDKKIPIYIADYVLSGYGTGAIMAVPAHDERDWDFAVKFGLEKKFVITASKDRGNSVKAESASPYLGEGYLSDCGDYSGMSNVEGGKKIVYDLAKKGLAKFDVRYKLRDWLISRQRYWGAPIPIVYCRNCFQKNKCGEKETAILEGVKYKIIPVPEEDLPVVLPPNVDFKPTGESPLKKLSSFVKTLCPKCGREAIRESDTMDTFVDSSWYFIRYCDPDNKLVFASKEKVDSWCPVDLYVGGTEHAVLHLLYARFITKFLRKKGKINFDEPFISLKNQGHILAPDGRKMSKSLGNVINPDDIVAEYGADTFRIYEMFMGPFESTKPWSTEGIVGVYRFLNKVWKISFSYSFKKANEKAKLDIEKLKKKVIRDIESFSFNTAIAEMMKFVKNIDDYILSLEIWIDFLKLLHPFSPHICSEIITALDPKCDFNSWVTVGGKTAEEEIKIPISINGKVKTVITAERNTGSEELKQKALNDPKINKILKGKKIKKIIVVPQRIVNIVV